MRLQAKDFEIAIGKWKEWLGWKMKQLAVALASGATSFGGRRPH